MSWLKTVAPMSVAVLCVAVMAGASTGQAEARGRVPPPPTPAPEPAPIVIGHRGASGYLPEHTIAAYSIAIEQGADFIEPDLVITKDGVLIARHENDIKDTTDVADHPEFAGRKTTKTIDGAPVTGWFAEDFTLAELKTLRAKERLPDPLRTANKRFNGDFTVPTFEEVLIFVKATNERFKTEAKLAGLKTPRQIGVYPETKHPSYFDGLGLSLEEPLLRALSRHGFSGRPELVFIQSFEVSNLKQLRGRTTLPLVQLLNAGGKPYDFVVNGDARTYADLATAAGLAEIATYADGVGVNKNLIFPLAADGSIGSAPTALIGDAHAVGLVVHGWTFRAENAFLPKNFDVGADPAAYGDLEGEIALFLKAGMDGFFSDNPDIGVAARDAFVAD